MTRRAILALLLAASPALAFPPSALEDMMAGLVATAGGGGYTDAVQEEPRLLFRVTTRDPSSYVLAGTNLASWTDIKGGIVGTSPTTNARLWIVENDLDGYPGFGLGGGQYLDLSAPIPSSNIMVVAVGFRATQATMWTVLSHTNATGGPILTLWNDAAGYYNPSGPNPAIASTVSFSATGASNRLILAAAHFGGQAAVTNTYLFINGTNRPGVGAFGVAAVASVFNRIGGRKSDGFAIARFNDISVYGNVNTTNDMIEIINKVKGVWGL